MRRIFNLSKKLLPKISDTEMIALQSGTISLDRDIMSGILNKEILRSLNNDCDNMYLYQVDFQNMNSLEYLQLVKQPVFLFHILTHKKNSFPLVLISYLQKL